jgi:hypothetical protein
MAHLHNRNDAAQAVDSAAVNEALSTHIPFGSGLRTNPRESLISDG